MDNIKLYKAIKKKLFLCNRNTDFLYMYKKNAFKMITHIKKIFGRRKYRYGSTVKTMTKSKDL